MSFTIGLALFLVGLAGWVYLFRKNRKPRPPIIPYKKMWVISLITDAAHGLQAGDEFSIENNSFLYIWREPEREIDITFDTMAYFDGRYIAEANTEGTTVRFLYQEPTNFESADIPNGNFGNIRLLDDTEISIIDWKIHETKYIQ
jgi:hypothetical protein